MDNEAYWLICDELNRIRKARTDVLYEAGLQRALDLLREHGRQDASYRNGCPILDEEGKQR